jgi:hypothetical protein
VSSCTQAVVVCSQGSVVCKVQSVPHGPAGLLLFFLPPEPPASMSRLVYGPDAAAFAPLASMPFPSSYYILSPQIGAVRGGSATVTPTLTTTYTLYATNQYGRTQATVTVTVP